MGSCEGELEGLIGDAFQLFDVGDVVILSESAEVWAAIGAPPESLGLVVRTYWGIMHGLEDDDPDGMSPGQGQVQIAWSNGSVDNIRQSKLQIEDRQFAVGDVVVKEGTCFGRVVSSVQKATVKLFKGGDATSRIVEMSPMKDPILHPRRPPETRLMQPFVDGSFVIGNGWLGVVESSKLSYTIRLQNNTTFLHKQSDDGLRPNQRDELSVESFPLYPSQKVAISGELMLRLSQMPQHENANVSLSQGVVEKFHVDEVQVNWMECGSLQHRLRPGGRQPPQNLRCISRPYLHLADRVYVHSQSGNEEDDVGGQFDLGRISSVRTTVSVQWQDGSITRSAAGKSIGFVPIEERLRFANPPLLPGQFVQQKLPNEGTSTAKTSQDKLVMSQYVEEPTTKCKWWDITADGGITLDVTALEEDSSKKVSDETKGLVLRICENHVLVAWLLNEADAAERVAELRKDIYKFAGSEDTAPPHQEPPTVSDTIRRNQYAQTELSFSQYLDSLLDSNYTPKDLPELEDIYEAHLESWRLFDGSEKQRKDIQPSDSSSRSSGSAFVTTAIENLWQRCQGSIWRIEHVSVDSLELFHPWHFIPGDFCVPRNTFSTSATEAEDFSSFLQIVAVYGGVVHCRNLHGSPSVFFPSELCASSSYFRFGESSSDNDSEDDSVISDEEEAPRMNDVGSDNDSIPSGSTCSSDWSNMS